MNGHILVMKGKSRYNVLRLAADEIAEGFADFGFDVTVADLGDNTTLASNFKLAMSQRYDLIFSLQALFFDLRASNGTSSFFNAYDVPVFGHIVDHPLFHHDRIAPSQGDNMYLACIDRNHVNYVNKYYPHIANVTHLTHGGFNPRSSVSYNERTIDVYFPSSYTSPEEVLDKLESLPDVYKKMAHMFIQLMLKDPMLTLQDALAKYLKEVKFTCDSEEFKEIMNILFVVDLYVRTTTRDHCIHSLLSNNIKVTVNGAGWDKFNNKPGYKLEIITDKGLDISQTLDIMGKSKMVLNHLPTYQNGMHERIYSSMRAGAISLTLDFPIVHEQFTDNENIILFQDSQHQVLADRVKYLLDHPIEAARIAELGKESADELHTWAHNSNKILRITGLL